MNLHILKKTSEIEVNYLETLKAIYTESELQLKSIKPTLNGHAVNSYFIKNDENLPLGFATLFVNEAIDYQQKKIACIGNFECSMDENAANELIDKICQEAKFLDCDFIIGPMNGSTWENYRLAIPSNEPLFLSEDYFPTYYFDLLIKNQFEVIERFISNRDQTVEISYEFEVQRLKFEEERGIQFREIPLEDYEKELPRLYEFCMLTFKNNSFFSPISEEGFIGKYTKLKSVLNSKSILIAENSSGQIIGLILSFPNLLNPHSTEIIVKTVAVHPDYQSIGLAKAMGSVFMKGAKNTGYTKVIHAFMQQKNTSVNVSNRYHGELLREYVLFGKSI